jgi:hypothetical protein
MYEHGPSFLGYAGDHIYYFSYKGSDGPARHEPYERKYSYEGLRAAARQLASLMRGIALDHPGTDVDLIAHSQGGIVARTYLEEMAKSENVHLPRVAHFITFSSPHTGAPLASNVASLQRTSAGRWVVARASDAARSGMPIPDPLSPAVAELAPGSGLMRSLARQDIEFGTRALALSTPDDPIVPADHARYPGHENRVVPPVVAWDPHDGIVSSPVAEGLTYDFLRDSPSSCLTGWDRWGPMVGAVVSGIEGRLGSAFNLGVGAARWVGAHALVP